MTPAFLGLNMNNVIGGNGIGKNTASAGTRIKVLIPPDTRGYTRITKIVYTAQATAHTLTIARPIGRTTASAYAASGQAVINLTADPNPSGNAIATNDLLAIKETDNVVRLYTVSSVATLAITLTSNLSVGVAQGAKVWSFGILGDSVPETGRAHDTLDGTASQTTEYEDREAGLFASFYRDEPILFDSDNATNAGTLKQLTYAYTS